MKTVTLSMIRPVLIAAAVWALGACTRQPGQTDISTIVAFNPQTNSIATLTCTSCHTYTVNSNIDPTWGAMTNATNGKHKVHVVDQSLACTVCHFRYTTNTYHMNGSMDATNTKVRVLSFETTNSKVSNAVWTNDTGIRSGSCGGLNLIGCHVDRPWYATN